MKSYIVTVYHNGSGDEKLCVIYPPTFATSFCMACAIVEKMALSDARFGVITKIEVQQS